MVAANIANPMLKYNSSILTGNVEERVRTLVEAGQLPLAYMAARAHGLTDMIEFIEQELQDSPEFDFMQIMDEAVEYEKRSKALLPLRPINN